MTDYSLPISLFSVGLAALAFIYTVYSNRKIRHDKRVERLADTIRNFRTILAQMKKWIPDLNDKGYLSAFDNNMFKLDFEVSQIEELNLDIDLRRESKSFLEDIEEIAKIFRLTDEPLKQFQETDQYGQSVRITKRQELFSKNKRLQDLIRNAESEAESWLVSNT